MVNSLCVIAGVAIVAILAGCDDGTESARAWSEETRWRDRIDNGILVDFKDYKAIELGMTLTEIENLLRATGFPSRGNEGTFIWRNRDSTGMACYFVNGKLAHKTSLGNLT